MQDVKEEGNVSPKKEVGEYEGDAGAFKRQSGAQKSQRSVREDEILSEDEALVGGHVQRKLPRWVQANADTTKEDGGQEEEVAQYKERNGKQWEALGSWVGIYSGRIYVSQQPIPSCVKRTGLDRACRVRIVTCLPGLAPWARQEFAGVEYAVCQLVGSGCLVQVQPVRGSRTFG